MPNANQDQADEMDAMDAEALRARVRELEQERKNVALAWMVVRRRQGPEVSLGFQNCLAALDAHFGFGK